MKQIASGAVGGIVAVGIVLLCGAGRPAPAPSSGAEYCDKEGRVRIRITAENYPSIQILDEAGRAVAAIGMDAKGPSCWINDAASKRRVGLVNDRRAGARLVVEDNAGTERVSLGGENKFHELAFWDEAGDRTVELASFNSNLGPHLMLTWKSKQRLWSPKLELMVPAAAPAN